MLPELEERGRGRPCRWWLRAPRRRRVSFEGGHTEDAIGRLRVGRAPGTSEQQGGIAIYAERRARVTREGDAQELNLGSRRIPHVVCCCCSLVAVTVGSRIAYVAPRQPSQVAGLRRRGKR